MQPRDERNSLEKRPFQSEVVIIHPVVSTLKVVWCQSACIYVYLTVKYSYAYVWNTCHIIYSACMSMYIYILCNYVLDIDIYMIIHDISAMTSPSIIRTQWIGYQVASHHLLHPRRPREGSRPGKWSVLPDPPSRNIRQKTGLESCHLRNFCEFVSNKK